MQKLLAKMTGRQIIEHLLLLAFILVAVAVAASHSHNPIMVQAIETDAFRLGTAEPGFQTASGSALATWENTRKMIRGRKPHNIPSGPSPIGNRHPPTRP